MSATGAQAVASFENMGVMGFTEVLSRLPAFYQLMKKLKQFMQCQQPQLLITIDFPGFNLRLCGEARKLGIPVLYYITPQIWAWGKNRINLMARSVNKVAVVFPFEPEIYRQRGIEVSFVGHPLLESVRVSGEKGAVKEKLGLPGDLPVLALLPGSRVHEVRRLLPDMLKTALILAQRRKIAVAVSAAPSVPEEEFDRITARFSLPVSILRGVNSELLYSSNAAIVASGSATLEAAILGTPMVIVYRVSPLSWFIAGRIVSIDHVGMVNIVAGRKIVPEYLQGGIAPERISVELEEMIFDEERRKVIVSNLAGVKAALGSPGASKKVAAIALGMVGS